MRADRTRPLIGAQMLTCDDTPNDGVPAPGARSIEVFAVRGVATSDAIYAEDPIGVLIATSRP